MPWTPPLRPTWTSLCCVSLPLDFSRLCTLAAGLAAHLPPAKIFLRIYALRQDCLPWRLLSPNCWKICKDTYKPHQYIVHHLGPKLDNINGKQKWLGHPPWNAGNVTDRPTDRHTYRHRNFYNQPAVCLSENPSTRVSLSKLIPLISYSRPFVPRSSKAIPSLLLWIQDYS